MKRLLLPGLLIAALAIAQSTEKKDGAVSRNVTGPFEVKLAPLDSYNKDDKAMGHFAFDKQFHGALEATSRGHKQR